MRERRAARELVLQALYAQELSDAPVSEVESYVIDESDLSEELKEFARKLFRTSVYHKDELDGYIKEKSLNWEFERIAVVDRLIMRMAICEFLYFDDIPPKVSISEAIEIAKKFSTENSSAFVNGILDAILREIVGKGLIPEI
ncbi:MAG: transcription antitermination factor NusB [Candidatus Neomarinimicrobiota bacterium]|nr:transcription antitermination factor NusB [Candidatus Neomarinimicrobiota bacterium]MCD6099929.1 transcription antitermination factor NusB [Candidatus Neomarinimicrobiota bacterium]RKY47207.1 MAG: transcription antitermination factor NusB [Candidatus Neomarinimicrobiota bacterium]RKY47240.1 MAG: transcription antitermination factor NusB [Candidatus Neomarinimicrobiota bacterium]RKY51250.1 MAG: transcription antitermination factor NusB [Candidatus Neomarinimicrobiota bacterium]